MEFSRIPSWSLGWHSRRLSLTLGSKCSPNPMTIQRLLYWTWSWSWRLRRITLRFEWSLWRYEGVAILPLLELSFGWTVTGFNVPFLFVYRTTRPSSMQSGTSCTTNWRRFTSLEPRWFCPSFPSAMWRPSTLLTETCSAQAGCRKKIWRGPWW